MKSINIKDFDWWLIGIYMFLVLFGWMNIYSALYTEEHPIIFDISQKFGMQFIWLASAFIIAALILFVIDPKIYSVLSPLFYGIVLLLLFAVIFVGKEINGSKSWFAIGSISFQPAELSKITTSLFLAYVMSKYGFKINQLKNAIAVAIIILIPMLLIVLEKETGSALVYAGLILMLYREGMSGWFIVFGVAMIVLFVVTLSFSPLVAILVSIASFFIVDGVIRRQLLKNVIICTILITALSFLNIIPDNLPILSKIKTEYLVLILFLPIICWFAYKAYKKRWSHIKYLIIGFLCAVIFTLSVNFIFNNIMQPHQRARIENLLGIQQDLRGIGYNVHQSKIAIGSGGLLGKGYLNGTQTKFNFVPEQSTDFIFCTIGEEWGFWGSALIVGLLFYMIGRIIVLSERQENSFVRIYGYCLASILFMHCTINIGMTIGIVPVIGIPLPFISYGGSSLWCFTALLFIFIRLLAEEQR